MNDGVVVGEMTRRGETAFYRGKDVEASDATSVGFGVVFFGFWIVERVVYGEKCVDDLSVGFEVFFFICLIDVFGEGEDEFGKFVDFWRVFGKY